MRLRQRLAIGLSVGALALGAYGFIASATPAHALALGLGDQLGNCGNNNGEGSANHDGGFGIYTSALKTSEASEVSGNTKTEKLADEEAGEVDVVTVGDNTLTVHFGGANVWNTCILSSTTTETTTETVNHTSTVTTTQNHTTTVTDTQTTTLPGSTTTVDHTVNHTQTETVGCYTLEQVGDSELPQCPTTTVTQTKTETLPAVTSTVTLPAVTTTVDHTTTVNNTVTITGTPSPSATPSPTPSVKASDPKVTPPPTPNTGASSTGLYIGMASIGLGMMVLILLAATRPMRRRRSN